MASNQTDMRHTGMCRAATAVAGRVSASSFVPTPAVALTTEP